MKTTLIFLWLCVFTITISFSQTVTVSEPAKCGLLPERIANIDRTLNELVTKKTVAGGVALIARKGQVGYLKAFGMKDIESSQPMPVDGIFRIASCTKAITIAAALMVMEEGHFRLNDPVSKFIPEFANMLVAVKDASGNATLEKAKSPILIGHLFNHTSGLTYDLFGPPGVYEYYVSNNLYNGVGATSGTATEMVKRLGSAPLVHHPGEKFHYGLNMEVLAAIIEVVTGKTLDRFLKERVFDPLGMNDTYFFLPDNKLNRLVTLYEKTQDGSLVKLKGMKKEGNAHYADYDIYASNKSYFAGGGGLLSTVSDYYKFLQMLANDGTHNGKRLLSRKTVELMTSEQTDTFSWWPGYGAGFGFAISRGPAKTGILGSEGEFRWLGFFTCHYFVDPKEDLIAIIFTQHRPDIGEVDQKFRVAVYQAVE